MENIKSSTVILVNEIRNLTPIKTTAFKSKRKYLYINSILRFIYQTI